MKLLKRLFLMLAVSIGFVNASEIPGYLGKQSFRLSDDRDLNELEDRSDVAKSELARAEQGMKQLGDQLRILENQQAQLKDKMEMLLKEVTALKTTKENLNTRIEELNKTPEANAEAIAALKKEVENLDLTIQEKNKQAGAIKLESAPVNVRIDQVRNDFNHAAKRSEEAQRRLQNIVKQREDYRMELIAAVKKINYEGSRLGTSDGRDDGADLSYKIAADSGYNDGTTDGLSQGTVDGQDRFYRRGAEQGERDGSSRARINGQRDGRNDGTNAGNSSAGAREGGIAGYKRGDASNAAQVGIDQGKKAGMERAVNTGYSEGRALGESETTRKLESSELKPVTTEGAFAGSFARRTPDYPGDFNGKSYRPSTSQSKEVLRKAFADGYIYSYREYTRYEFQRRIATDYNTRYDLSYKTAYDTAVNRDYPTYFDQGRREADALAYNRDYPIIKAENYKIAFEQFASNPNRSSNEFKNSYAQTEVLAFNERYEAIRSANFSRVEGEVFKANIAEQTEVNRQKRTVEVNAIYNNHPVLQFVSSEILDGGINGVASLDGVFQPNEVTKHIVVIKNFGFKEAKNVSVLLNNGAAVTLPPIAPRSTVTVKGAILGTVSEGLNANFRSSLRVISPLSSNDAVQGRHYEERRAGIVKSNDSKQVRVQYPLALSGLSLESQLLKGTKNKLKISVTNNSRREYKGELQINLLTNSQNPIITKGFSPLTQVASTVSASDAEILVDSEQDAYRDLAISATITQNGVTIGQLPQDFITMAKAQFFDKGQVPVLVANSDVHLNDFLDALNTLGGSDKVSILDLSLANLNAASLQNGLSEKVLLIVDDANGTSIKTLNTFISKSKTSAFLMIDSAKTGLKNAQKLASFKDAIKLPINKRQVVFTNPHRAGVTKASAFMQSSLINLGQDLAIAHLLSLSATNHLADLKEKVTAVNFNTPNDSLKVYLLKSLSEVMAINIAYDESGNIFNRDKKWARMISEDSTLFHNQLKAASSGSVVVSKLPHVLSAIALKEFMTSALDRGDGVYRGMMLKITNATKDVMIKMEDSFKKSLKSNFKDVYNKAYANASTHNPFYIAPPIDPNN